MRLKWRFWVAAALLSGTALLLYARNSSEIIPARQPLASFPRTLGSWASSSDIPLSPEILDILGPGDFLLRDYRDSASAAYVNLFIAYFPTQRSGDAIHSPKNCLPGAGWTPVQSDRIMVSVPGHPPFAANRYLIARGEDRQLVLYWYWAHDRAVASEYAAKFYLVADSIREHRSDGSLIRVTTGLAPDESLDSGERRLLALAGDVVPLINGYVPQ
jgi:EpsI family protein